MKRGIEALHPEVIHKIAHDHRQEIASDARAGVRDEHLVDAGHDTVDIVAMLEQHLAQRLRRHANVTTERVQRRSSAKLAF